MLNCILKLVNKIKDAFSSIDIEYTLCDKQGEVFNSGTDYIIRLAPKGYVFSAPHGLEREDGQDVAWEDVDWENCTFKITGFSRKQYGLYKRVSQKKLVYKKFNYDKNGSGTFEIKIYNKMKEDACGHLYAIQYRKDGQISRVVSMEMVLEAKKYNKCSVKFPYVALDKKESNSDNLDHYEIIFEGYY